MLNRRVKVGTGHAGGVWPVLLVLLVSVLVPTACVLWFMNAAMRNERLAVRQRLTDIYREQLSDSSAALNKYWAGKLAEVQAASGLKPADAFARLVRSGAADSVIVYDKSGAVAYPIASTSAGPGERKESTQWAEAERLEYELSQPQKAADAYAKITAESKDANLQAQAMQAQARCLVKAGGKAQAIKVLTGPLAKDEYRDATDTHGRFIVPNSQLLVLQLLADLKQSEFQAVAKSLTRRLNDYAQPAMPSSQRLFLMQALPELSADIPSFPTLAAETLAAEYLETGGSHLAEAGLRPSALDGAWQFASPDGRIVAIFSDSNVAGVVESLTPKSPPLVGAKVIAHHGDDSGVSAEPFLTMPASEHMPGWRLSLYLDKPDPFAAAARRQNAAYLWIGSLSILTIAFLAIVVSRYIGRQIRLTRLKNDLIATVSHELKTPLASMRVLVDTLLEGRCEGQQQANEYFRLIAKENARLSRLIDNFLTFSRMERNKKAFEFDKVDVGETVTAAVDSVRERFTSPQCRLDVDVAADLPAVNADRDALITVVLNLLDNAWKYSGEQKHVHLRTYTANGAVCIKVSDNGVGMSRRAARRIFNKFYQVDQTLTRSDGGCGLGLSIVKFIIDAHGGSIDVTSRQGEGSTFTVRLPAATATVAAES